MFKRIFFFMEDFFGISPKESRGAVVLLCFSLLFLAVPSLYRNYLSSRPGAEGYHAGYSLDSLAALLDTDTIAAAHLHERVVPVALFKFDPNVASIDTLLALGIPPLMARRIDNYRKKGGRFYEKKDLLRIYDFPQDIYNTLAPYVIASGRSGPQQKWRSGGPEQRKVSQEVREYRRRVEIVPFDLNTADTTQLIALRGIGSKLAQRIVRFRDGLGGFYAKEQVREVFGLDSLALEALDRYGMIVAPVRKIAVNSATYSELSTHTYLRRQPQLIRQLINFREQHGPYTSEADFKKLRHVDIEILQKVAPYFTYD